MGRWQVGEWRGWVGRHIMGLGLHPVAGAGAAWHMTGWEEGGERRWGWFTCGVAWVCAIGGVAVAHDRAGDMWWVAGGRMERVGARSVWVGEWAGWHVPQAWMCERQLGHVSQWVNSGMVPYHE